MNASLPLAVTTVQIFLASLGVLFYLGLIYALTTWAIRDAEARGKPGWAVALLVLITFPLGPAVWALLRPPLLAPTKSEKPFKLDHYRVQ